MARSINIVSDSAKQHKFGGPGKVFINTLKGFRKIDQPYTVNGPISKNRYNWIHDSIKGFIEVIVYEKPSVTGPNLFVFPSEIPHFLPEFPQNIYLHPSAWCVEAWERLNFKSCRMNSWPVGIDLDEFSPSTSRKRNEVLLYYKKRKSIKANEVYEILEKINLKVNLISYGSYSEDQYLEALNNSSFGVWVGTTESQGIGLQEALATNLPLIVIENSNILDHDTPEINTFPSSSSELRGTTVPYWDERCGIIIDRLEKLEPAIAKMQESLQYFAPREYIKETLSLEKCAENLVRMFEELDFSKYDSLEKRIGSVSKYARFRFILSAQFIVRTLYKIRRAILKYIK